MLDFVLMEELPCQKFLDDNKHSQVEMILLSDIPESYTRNPPRWSSDSEVIGKEDSSFELFEYPNPL